MAQLTSSRSKKQEKPEGKTRPPSQQTPASNPAAGILGLQRTTGNSAVNQLMQHARADESGQSESGQPLIGSPGDTHEQEADRVAEQALSTQQPLNEETAAGRNADNQKVSGESGQPLSPTLRAFFGSRLGYDFSRVRLHTDAGAEQSAEALGAHAFTTGDDIVFGAGQYSPDTPGGMKLLAHELTHVAQQGDATSRVPGGPQLATQSAAAPQIQGSFFGDVWEGIKSAGKAVGGAIVTAGKAIAKGARAVGRFLTGAAEYVGEKLRDLTTWAVELVRNLPARIARLATTIVEGLVGVVTFIPGAIRALASGGLKGFASWLWEKAKRGGAWVLTLVSRVLDVLGVPEALEFIWHIITKARPLTGPEITAASSVLGPTAIRWGDVRVSEGGLLALIFKLNNARAFTTFHTINLPPNETIDVVVHELAHVYQYERAGSVYIGQAIHAQATIGYGYGGAAGLVADKAAGKHYKNYNREQQAQIAQDYYKIVIVGGGAGLSPDQRAAYDYYVGELRAGDL